ncbi:MAG TPA: hypothetical protein VK864_02945 [Longimicrobiales bacterium]|nr:hypothetical protein [Longimicrobiales bacterium]
MRSPITPVCLALTVAALGCASDVTSPSMEPPRAGVTAWGPEDPFFNLEVILRGDGFGLVKFRQPNDGDPIVYLDTWVRDLAPHTSYLLQRAVDSTIDGDCTSDAWLTLGKGLTPQAITTDENGAGRESLFRAVPPLPGQIFDIHFRVIEENTGTVALQSRCYTYVISL